MLKLKSFFVSALLLASLTAFAQQITVTGVVTSSADGYGVIGAAVMEKGTSNGAVTDFDGNFTLKVEAGKILEISCIGYRTVETVAASSISIVLDEDVAELSEVVVTGYQTQRKADLTGSVSVIKTDEMKTTSGTDPMRALQGRVPGMTITSNGSPSGAGTVRIRGIGSFNSSQDPLYIIDGVPTTSGLNSLNTNDIESMQVLKDAASASIYGSRAANGVIVITTRKGKKGDKVSVDFSANLTAQTYNKQSMMSLSNSAEYATAMAQAALNDGLDPVTYAANYGLDLNAAAGQQISAYDPASGEMKSYTINGLYDGYVNSKKTMRFSDTDWLKAISRTGFLQSYDLSLSNVSDRSSVLVSVGYKNNLGILKFTDFDNIAARVNSTLKINKWVSIGENLTITHTSQVDGAPMENALKMAPTHLRRGRRHLLRSRGWHERPPEPSPRALPQP